MKHETFLTIFKYSEIFLEFEIATRGEIKSCIWLQRYDRENDQMVKNCNFFRFKSQNDILDNFSAFSKCA